MEQTILTDAHRKVLALVASEPKLAEYYLSGGTALAAYYVEFTRYPFSSLNSFVTFDGMRVDRLRDIAANRLMTLLDRFDPVDDIFLGGYLLQNNGRGKGDCGCTKYRLRGAPARANLNAQYCRISHA